MQDLLPPELIFIVCQLACTDDGRTYRALSHVSKAFRNIVLPLRFQALVITELAQAASILEALESSPAHLRPIQSLFITLDAVQDAVARPSTPVSTIQRIISIAAPTISNLTVALAHPSKATALIAQLFRTRLPYLRSLALVGFYPFPSAGLAGTNLPSLETLHLHGNRNPYGLLQPACLAAAAPALKDLRISGLNQASSFLKELEESIRASQAASEISNPSDDYETDSSLEFGPILPTQLRRVTIQQSPLALPGNTKHDLLRQSREACALESLRRLSFSPHRPHRVSLEIEQPMTVLDAAQVADRAWLHQLETN